MWTLQDIVSGEQSQYCWPRNDLAVAMGIKGIVTPSQMELFCEWIMNREINFILNKPPKAYAPLKDRLVLRNDE